MGSNLPNASEDGRAEEKSGEKPFKYVGERLETRDALYWTLHPEKRPAYIYVPEQRVNEDALPDEMLFASLDRLCDYRRVEAQQGTILQVTAWHLP